MRPQVTYPAGVDLRQPFSKTEVTSVIRKGQ